jgi:hypothetical protein
MSLAEKLTQTKRSEPGLPCGIAKVLSVLQGDDREALELVLSSAPKTGVVSNRQLHEILLSEGHDIAYSSVALHRRKQCRCFVGKNSDIRQEIIRKEP